MEKHWDEIDRQAEAEGKAVGFMNIMNPRKKSSSFGKLRRMFDDDICSKLEAMSSSEFKKLMKRTDILSYLTNIIE